MQHHHVIHQPDRGPTNNLHAPARPLLPKLMAAHDHHHCILLYYTIIKIKTIQYTFRPFELGHYLFDSYMEKGI